MPKLDNSARTVSRALTKTPEKTPAGELAPVSALPVITDKLLGRITGLAAAGSTEGAIARSLGLSQARWRALKKADDRVADALAEGLAADLNTALHALRAAALDRSGKMRKGGMVPLLAYLKMKHGLRDHGAAPAADGNSGVNVQIVLPGALTHEQFTTIHEVSPMTPLQKTGGPNGEG